MHIEVVTIGDELLLGYTIDTNAAHLARTLAAEGVEIERRTTVGDRADAIASAVRDGLERTGAVITTGGLGPTSDDLTKQSIAALFGRGMLLDEAHLAWMAERFTRLFQRPMPDANRQQAMLPEGARKLRNNHGSAPGIWLEDERGRWVAMLRSLDAAAFARTMRHPEMGVFDLNFLCALYAWHSLHHEAHITRLREREGWARVA